MRLALLTSDHIRHKFFASVLTVKHDLRLVIAEGKGNAWQQKGDNKLETEILRSHFIDFEKTQKEFFGNIKEFPNNIPEVVHIPRGDINSFKVVEKIKWHKIEGIAVFGCGILNNNVIKLCPGKVINAHQGLSPYYRGSGTNFWPFVNDELEYVGVTIHNIDAGIDTGGIICHGRPNLEIGDSMHMIGCKIIRISANLVSRVFLEIEKGRLQASIPQWEKGRLYTRKDYNAQAVLKARKNIEEGIVKKYIVRVENENQPLIQLVELI